VLLSSGPALPAFECHGDSFILRPIKRIGKAIRTATQRRWIASKDSPADLRHPAMLHLFLGER
jgi:hypothetical protein